MATDRKTLKPEHLALAAQLTDPLIGLLGLPPNLTSLSISVKAGDFVKVDCSFLITNAQYDAVSDSIQKAFKQYKLVEIDNDN